ncbi:universal stress protein [Chromatocurvus halotolerans]|uniref:Nucleotide-binding universal stress UspA family protein n=1 Tax=Chromatocurvus halotolerans TaxID=1132028 RepID=A0A4R2L0F8_9GAMM|nr:universal stress protein [Chromatocurvus halotolerans]TCO77166.1 nucleotide-binding universal stress UspA family protein [Chromatocurvus halotolerans]
MYQRIGVPVDLEHPETLAKAMATASTLASAFGASLHLVAVTSPSPGAVARNPQAFAERLTAYADECSARHGVIFTPHVRVCDDPAVELDRTLSAAFHQLEVDLLVVASHVPGLRDYVFASNAGWLASHTDLSVFVVR